MAKRVVITGLGPISGLGIGIDQTWPQVVAGQSAVAPLRGFDASGFGCPIGSEVEPFKVRDYVPKSYRKATKVMARDIELAVVAADLAAHDAGLVTRSQANGSEVELTYAPPRMGAHIGAGLIAAELNELTAALSQATDEQGQFDYHRWGQEGLGHLTPLWLLKYLPNMLACHVTIIHDAQGPSNTITCGEASALLSIGESLRVIQRGAADLCFCGGAESKLNPMTFLRQHMTDRLNTTDLDPPDQAVRPFCEGAAGTVVGEGGGIVVLESLETFQQRCGGEAGGRRAYGEVIGFGASQSVNRQSRGLTPDPQGLGVSAAIRAAMREAGIEPSQIDLIVPFGTGTPAYDRAEAEALRRVFGQQLPVIPIASAKSLMGTCGAGTGGLDVCIAAKALDEQTVPARINCDQPLAQLNARSGPAQSTQIDYVLVYSSGLGGQNAALVLKKVEA